MGSPFAEVERKYADLSQSYQQGDLNPEQFAEALDALRIQDDQEQWWQIQGNGKWLRYSGSAWEEATPPRPGPPPPPRAALAPPPRKAQPRPISEAKEPASAAILGEPIGSVSGTGVLREANPVRDLDDSIFFQTGLAAEQIPSLNDPEPAPGAFLIEEQLVASPQPLPLQVQCRALASPPKRPAAEAAAPEAKPPVEALTPAVAPPSHLANAPELPPSGPEIGVLCPKCNKHSPPGANFCQACGFKSNDQACSSVDETCPSCGRALLPNSKFCGSCGQSLKQLNCPKCQTPKLPGGRFCKSCGHAFK